MDKNAFLSEHEPTGGGRTDRWTQAVCWTHFSKKTVWEASGGLTQCVQVVPALEVVAQRVVDELPFGVCIGGRQHITDQKGTGHCGKGTPEECPASGSHCRWAVETFAWQMPFRLPNVCPWGQSQTVARWCSQTTTHFNCWNAHHHHTKNNEQRKHI